MSVQAQVTKPGLAFCLWNGTFSLEDSFLLPKDTPITFLLETSGVLSLYAP